MTKHGDLKNNLPNMVNHGLNYDKLTSHGIDIIPHYISYFRRDFRNREQASHDRNVYFQDGERYIDFIIVYAGNIKKAKPNLERVFCTELKLEIELVSLVIVIFT